MRIEYSDIEDMMSDISEALNAIQIAANTNKRFKEEQSTNYQIIEDFCFNVNKVVTDNMYLVKANLSNVTGIDISNNNRLINYFKKY